MTDLEITKLCAEAMGLPFRTAQDGTGHVLPLDTALWRRFDPLHDDSQAMALVKKFRLCIDGNESDDTEWLVEWWPEGAVMSESAGLNEDLNRAICECVANMRIQRGAK